MTITKIKLFKNLVLALFLIFISEVTLAFPEMIKHGYTNCTACHVSPSGGGLLNQYGRSLSAELISTWSYENEQNFLHGTINTEKVNDWLAIGGDYRGIQVHSDTTLHNGERTESGRWINMQAGLEVGILQPKWAAVAFIGEYNVKDSDHKNEILLNSPRYYLMYKPLDELALRAGQFQPTFGINLPDHILSTRGALDLGYIQNKSTAEASWLGEIYNFTMSYYSILKKYSTKNEKGIVLTASRLFADRYKLGLQYLNEKGDTQTKQIMGVTGQLGWNEKVVTLFEADSVNIKPNTGSSRNGLSLIQRTAYEVHKGVNLAFLNDYGQSDLDDGSKKVYKYGPGLIWYPRPHFDFQLFYTKEQRSIYKNEADVAWLMTHYYF